MQKSASSLLIYRLLTLICFFHFSGINNGYAALPLDLAPHATLSVMLITKAVRICNVFPKLDRGFTCVQTIYGLSANFTLKTKAILTNCLDSKSRSIRIDRIRLAKTKPFINFSSSNFKEGRKGTYLKKEEWISQKV